MQRRGLDLGRFVAPRGRLEAVPRRGLGLELSSHERERREAVARRGLNLGQSGDRRGRRDAMPRRRLGLGQSGGRRKSHEAMPRRGLDCNVDQRKRGEASRWTLSKVETEGKAVRPSGGGVLDEAGADEKALKRSVGAVRGSDSGHEWPSKVGLIRGVHTRSVSVVVTEIVIDAGKQGYGVESAEGRWY